jgi:hypothetical protein
MLDSSDLLAYEQLLADSAGTLPTKSGQSPTPFAGKPKEIQEEINNLILTYNSELKQWYKYFTNVDKVEFEEGFMMVARQFWRFLEVCKILNVSFPLSFFDRIYLRGKKTFFSLRYNPFYGATGKKDEWRATTPEMEISKKDTFEQIEERKDDISLERVDKSSLIPIKPYEGGHFHSSNLFDNAYNRDQMDMTDEELPIEDIEPFEKEDVHDPMRSMLFRHFVEGIIRAAYLYYINDSRPLKAKLSSLFNDKLKPNLPEIAKRGKRKEYASPIPGLVFTYEELLKPFNKDLLEIFRMYSGQAKVKHDQFLDNTLSVATFKEMLETVLGKENATLELLLNLVEEGFDEDKRYSAMQKKEDISNEEKTQMEEEYVKCLMAYELVYYEYKRMILQLAQHVKGVKELKEEKLKEFVNEWVDKLRRKETKTVLPYKRTWKVSEKEIK